MVEILQFIVSKRTIDEDFSMHSFIEKSRINFELASPNLHSWELSLN